jgi:5-methylcytosine-specific restriction endonuclease McrA
MKKITLSERMKKDYRSGKRKSWNKGKKVDYGWKISESMKGKIPANLSLINANKKGSGNPMWGRVEDEEHKKWRMRNTVGRVKSIEERKKLSKANSGPKGSNWQGGISPKNKKIRKSLEFKLWREAVFARDGWCCQKCGKKGGYLHPHHILNFAEFVKLRFAIDNGITLCIYCHNKFHNIFGRTKNNKKQLTKFLYGN